MSVWVLVFYVGAWTYGNHSGIKGGASIIDNIATQEECVRVQQLLPLGSLGFSRCIEVRKAK